jgi:peptidoglycan/LPS O-acetylase OafA/YrhL
MLKPVASLNHLRALAILMVFLYHYQRFAHPDWLGTVAHFGWSGVDLFFVISGYLISGQLFRTLANGKSIRINEFFIKRFFRIIPVYLFVLSIYFLVPAFREREALPPLWKFLTFSQNFGLDAGLQGTFSHAWSLCIEEQFYLFFPFLILLFVYFKIEKKAIYLIVFLFLAGFIIRMISWNEWVAPHPAEERSFVISWYRWIYYPTYNRLDGLLAGVSVAGLFQFYPRIKNAFNTYANFVFFLGIGLLVAAGILCEDPSSFQASVFGFPAVAIAYGLILAAAVCPACFLYHIDSKYSSGLATLSYSIYLSHKGIIHLSQDFFVKWTGLEASSTLILFICAAMSVFISLLLRYAIEKPFLVLRDTLLATKKTQALVF